MKARIGQAKMWFNSKHKLLCHSSISLENRKIVLLQKIVEDQMGEYNYE